MERLLAALWLLALPAAAQAPLDLGVEAPTTSAAAPTDPTIVPAPAPAAPAAQTVAPGGPPTWPFLLALGLMAVALTAWRIRLERTRRRTGARMALVDEGTWRDDWLPRVPHEAQREGDVQGARPRR